MWLPEPSAQLQVHLREVSISIGAQRHDEVQISGDWPEVIACRDEFTRLLQNLIGNALKYHAPNRPPVIEVGVAPLADGWRFWVADNGIGIDKHDLVHIFDRFYRVDKSRSRKVGGSGLGLSIVKHIIEAHNQTVSVRSTINKGSTFSFTLKKFKK